MLAAALIIHKFSHDRVLFNHNTGDQYSQPCTRGQGVACKSMYPEIVYLLEHHTLSKQSTLLKR